MSDEDRSKEGAVSRTPAEQALYDAFTDDRKKLFDALAPEAQEKHLKWLAEPPGPLVVKPTGVPPREPLVFGPDAATRARWELIVDIVCAEFGETLAKYRIEKGLSGLKKARRNNVEMQIIFGTIIHAIYRDVNTHRTSICLVPNDAHIATFLEFGRAGFIGDTEVAGIARSLNSSLYFDAYVEDTPLHAAIERVFRAVDAPAETETTAADVTTAQPVKVETSRGGHRRRIASV